MIADIEQPALRDAVTRLESNGCEVRGVVCDVADAASVDSAARQAVDALGNVHILCNNAGVGGGSGTADISVGSWRWVLDVNLLGVVYALRAFLPHIRAHGEGGHIVNTASMAGLLSQGAMGFSPYTASKHAIVGISEGLRAELAPDRIGVTVVCPGFVRTRIADAGRNRPARYGAHAAGPHQAAVAELVQGGIEPDIVADRILAAVRDDELYVLTHPAYRAAVEARFDRILAAFDKLEDVSR
jgi:NAD(P)-dependent dehydrogenase (short-subunit alcohol dehydrogenase family)